MLVTLQVEDLKPLKLLLGLAVLIVVGAGVVFFSNTPSQTANPNSPPSFTYAISDRTVTFYAATGFANYAWSFGDSSTGTGATVSHTYDANGRYAVTLTAEPIAGASTPLSTFQQVIINTVTLVVHNYFVNLNVTVGNTAH